MLRDNIKLYSRFAQHIRLVIKLISLPFTKQITLDFILNDRNESSCSWFFTSDLSRLRVKQKIVQFPLVSMLRMLVQYLDKVGSDDTFHL